MRSHTGLRRLVAATSITLLGLAGCGSDDDGSAGEVVPTTEPPAADAAELADDDASQGVDVGADRGEVPAPELSLPGSPTVAAGHQVVDARCAHPDELGGMLTFAVPEGWERSGTSSAGSGGVLDGVSALDFDTGDGSVRVEVDVDHVDLDGNPLGDDGEPWESFDYEWSTYGDGGERSGTITYELAGTVTVADQEVEVHLAERDQEPDVLGATEHRARVELARLPGMARPDQLLPHTAVVTISHDPEGVDLGLADVADILGSLAIPTCVHDALITELEVLHGQDLDGDGHVASIEDLLDQG